MRAVLEARTEMQHLAALGQPGDADGVPASSARTSLGRLRLALNRILTESIPLPDTHRDGHGNGQVDQLTAVSADEAGQPGREQGGAEYPEREEHRARR